MAHQARWPMWRNLLIVVVLIAMAWIIQVKVLGRFGTTIPYPYLIYYPAVMIAALYGGLSAGLLAATMSVILAAQSWAVHVGRPFDISGLNDQLRLAIFLFNCILTSVVSHVLHKAKAVAVNKAEAEHRLAVELEQTASVLREREKQQKRLEETLRRSRDELEDLVAERTRELEVKNQELQSFSVIASHDMQEPLRKIQIFGDRLRIEFAEALGEQGRDFLTRMEEAAGRMSTLIDDLLAYSRVSTRQLPFKAVGLGTLVSDALADLDQKIEKTGGRVEIGALPEAEVDPVQMRQVFQNLLSNSLKYHGDTPPVITVSGEIVLENGRSLVRVTVQDNGIGFDAKYLDKIFQPFQRLHKKSAYEGTGIGLAIVNKVVERHGGTITAKSEPGQGAIFIMNIPLKQSAASKQDIQNAL